MRSLNTSITALLPVGVAAGPRARSSSAPPRSQEFALALLIGLFAGAYSSIFIASPLLAVLKEREPQYQRHQGPPGRPRRRRPPSQVAAAKAPAGGRRRHRDRSRRAGEAPDDGVATAERPRAAARPVRGARRSSRRARARRRASAASTSWRVGGSGSLIACPRSIGSCLGGATSARRRTRSRPCSTPSAPGTRRPRPG